MMSLNASLSTAKAFKNDQDSTKYIMDIVSIVFYFVTIVLGVTGNSIVIWMAGFKIKPKVTNVLLMNLAIADLIFCFTRVFSLLKKLYFTSWPFGLFLCKFNGFFKYANMFCSVFLLAVISLDRVLCIWQPVFTKRRRTLCAARIVAVCVWGASILLSSPFFIYRQVLLKKNVSRCTTNDEDPKSTKRLPLFCLRFMCGFMLPFLVILVCYVLAGIGIRRTRLPRKSRSLRILASLVVAFFLCWAPYHCLLLVKMTIDKNKVVAVWYPLAKSIAYMNSCVNPLLYFFMGMDLRAQFSLSGIFRRALADDGDGQMTHSNDRSLEDSGASKHTTVVVAGSSPNGAHWPPA